MTSRKPFTLLGTAAVIPLAALAVAGCGAAGAGAGVGAGGAAGAGAGDEPFRDVDGLETGFPAGETANQRPPNAVRPSPFVAPDFVSLIKV